MKIFNFFKKPLESVSDEITTKFKTPFFSTYIVVWLIRNNLFVYDLLFNSSITDRTNTLKTQFNIHEWGFYSQTLLSVLITLGLMILLYILLNISRMITIVSEERIKLNILQLFKSKTIGSKEDIDFWKGRVNELNQKNFSLQDELNISRSSNELDNTNLRSAKKTIQDFNDGRKLLRSNIDSLLTNRLYNHEVTLNKTKVIEVDKLKELVDGEFNKFEKVGKTPTFLST